MRPIAHSLAAIAALILSPFIALAWLVRPQVRQGFGERLGRIEPAEGPGANEENVLGPSIFSYRSPGLQAVLAAVPSDGSCRVLDLGPAVGDNVTFISSIAEVVQIVDIFGGSSAGSGDGFAAVDRGLATLRTLDRSRRRSHAGTILQPADRHGL